MSVKYPVQKIEGKRIPWIKKRLIEDTREFVWYTISWEDAEEYPTRVLHNLARKFYRNSEMWHLIYEVNLAIPPEDYEPGMKIKIPITTAFREASVVRTTR